MFRRGQNTWGKWDYANVFGAVASAPTTYIAFLTLKMLVFLFWWWWSRLITHLSFHCAEWRICSFGKGKRSSSHSSCSRIQLLHYECLSRPNYWKSNNTFCRMSSTSFTPLLLYAGEEFGCNFFFCWLSSNDFCCRSIISWRELLVKLYRILTWWWEFQRIQGLPTCLCFLSTFLFMINNHVSLHISKASLQNLTLGVDALLLSDYGLVVIGPKATGFLGHLSPKIF